MCCLYVGSYNKKLHSIMIKYVNLLLLYKVSSIRWVSDVESKVVRKPSFYTTSSIIEAAYLHMFNPVL